MIIREILPQDNMSIKAIITNCFKEYNLPIAGSSLEDNDANYMYQGFQQLRAVYYVIEDGDKILGGGGIKHLLGAKNDICELQKMYFHPDIRGQGYRLGFDAIIPLKILKCLRLWAQRQYTLEAYSTRLEIETLPMDKYWYRATSEPS